MDKIKHSIKKLIICVFNVFGFRLYFGKKVNLPILKYDEDQIFKDTFNKIKPFTVIDVQKAFILYQMTKHSLKFAGDIAEVGVYKGGTAKLFSCLMECFDKKLHLFDTFEGMPEVRKDLDTHDKGDFHDTSLAKVKENVGEYKNVLYYKGLFPKTATPIKDKTFCLVHIDVDIYQSVKDCCEFFYNRIEKNGVMIFDDYGFPSCPGARKAVDEYFQNKPEYLFYLPTGQAFIFKN